MHTENGLLVVNQSLEWHLYYARASTHLWLVQPPRETHVNPVSLLPPSSPATSSPHKTTSSPYVLKTRRFSFSISLAGQEEPALIGLMDERYMTNIENKLTGAPMPATCWISSKGLVWVDTHAGVRQIQCAEIRDGENITIFCREDGQVKVQRTVADHVIMLDIGATTLMSHKIFPVCLLPKGASIHTTLCAPRKTPSKKPSTPTKSPAILARGDVHYSTCFAGY
jgi:hypothetical protein